MLEGSCHCGEVRWTLEGAPDAATACNCTACRRYGALWAYGHEDEDIRVTGETQAYTRGQKVLSFDFCRRCGCVVCWRSVGPNPDGRRRMAVNLRLAEPETVAHIPIEHFDGLETWRDLPRDGRCVRDLWF